MAWPICRALYPGFSKISHDKAKLRASYLKSLNIILGIALPFGVGMSLVAHDFILLFLGDQWLESVPLIQYITVVYAVMMIGVGSDPLFYSLGHSKLPFYRSLIGMVIKVICSFWAILLLI